MSMSEQERIEEDVEALVREHTGIRVACALAKTSLGVTAMVEALEAYAKEEMIPEEVVASGIVGLLEQVYDAMQPYELAGPDAPPSWCGPCARDRNRSVELKLGNPLCLYCPVCGWRYEPTMKAEVTP